MCLRTLGTGVYSGSGTVDGVTLRSRPQSQQYTHSSLSSRTRAKRDRRAELHQLNRCAASSPFLPNTRCCSRISYKLTSILAPWQHPKVFAIDVVRREPHRIAEGDTFAASDPLQPRQALVMRDAINASSPARVCAAPSHVSAVMTKLGPSCTP
jgi:hypothetical protein